MSTDPLQHGNALVSRVLDEHIQHLRFRRRFDHDYLARPDDRYEGVLWQEFVIRAFRGSVPPNFTLVVDMCLRLGRSHDEVI